MGMGFEKRELGFRKKRSGKWDWHSLLFRTLINVCCFKKIQKLTVLVILTFKTQHEKFFFKVFYLLLSKRSIFIILPVWLTNIWDQNRMTEYFRIIRTRPDFFSGCIITSRISTFSLMTMNFKNVANNICSLQSFSY